VGQRLGGCVHLPPSKIGERSYRELAEFNGDLQPLPKALRDRLVPWDRADKRGPKPSAQKITLKKVKRNGKTEKASSRRSRSFHRTDTGNAERLITRHGEELRWVEELGWLYWDGQRWKTDEAQAHRLAIETTRSIYGEIAEARTDSERTDIAKWAVRSEAAEKRRAMLDTGRWIEPINVKVAELDRDPLLLNVANGHRGSPCADRPSQARRR
jgi:phage/plasmid-associated DNA primase